MTYTGAMAWERPAGIRKKMTQNHAFHKKQKTKDKQTKKNHNKTKTKKKTTLRGPEIEVP